MDSKDYMNKEDHACNKNENYKNHDKVINDNLYHFTNDNLNNCSIELQNKSIKDQIVKSIIENNNSTILIEFNEYLRKNKPNILTII